MAHELARSHIISRIKNALNLAESVDSLQHNGLKGRAREIFASNLIEPLLPPQFAIGHGKVIDAYGNSSPESDVIIYDKSVLPPILLDGKIGLFPIESCHYVIEVKSTLTAKELKKTISNFNILWNLKPMKSEGNRPATAIFAFDSDLKQTSELDRYVRYDVSRNNLGVPKCMALCIAKKGYHYFSQKDGNWKTFNGDKTYDEIIDFLGGVSNTVFQTQPERNNVSYGNYFMKRILPDT